MPRRIPRAKAEPESPAGGDIESSGREDAAMSPTVREVAHNELLTAFARVMMAVGLPVLSLIAYLTWGTINDRFMAQSKELVQWTQKIDKIEASVNSKLTSQDEKYDTLKLDVAKLSNMFEQMKAEIQQDRIAQGQFQRDTALRLDKVTDTLGTISTTLTQMTTAQQFGRENANKEHEYFRDYIRRQEEEKARRSNLGLSIPQELRPR